MSVVRLPDRLIMAASPLAASRANRDGVVDLGANEDLRRQKAAEKLEDALRFYRTVYGSDTLAKLLECKLDAEQRLISRELERAKP
jgi:hypothetical protein